MGEPKYDEDGVNLGYLRRILGGIETVEQLKNTMKTIIEDYMKPVENLLAINMEYFDSIEYNQVVKTGKVVSVFFRGKTNNQIPAATDAITLPYRPLTNSTFPVYSGGQYNLTNPVFGYITKDTTRWRMGTIPTNTWIQASITYITSD